MEYVHFDSDDLRKNNVTAALGCLIFPLPLLLCPGSKLGRFCANEGLLLLLASLVLKGAFGVVNALVGWIPLVGPLLRLCGSLLRAAIVVWAFYLAWRTYNRRPERLPGDIHILDR